MDDDGYLFVIGRIKEIINRGGEKIHPQDIDTALDVRTGGANRLASGRLSAWE